MYTDQISQHNVIQIMFLYAGFYLADIYHSHFSSEKKIWFNERSTFYIHAHV